MKRFMVNGSIQEIYTRHVFIRGLCILARVQQQLPLIILLACCLTRLDILTMLFSFYDARDGSNKGLGLDYLNIVLQDTLNTLICNGSCCWLQVVVPGSTQINHPVTIIASNR